MFSSGSSWIQATSFALVEEALAEEYSQGRQEPEIDGTPDGLSLTRIETLLEALEADFSTLAPQETTRLEQLTAEFDIFCFRQV